MRAGSVFTFLLALTMLAQPATDPLIDAARKAAAAYSASLPDYVVQRTTTRTLGRRETNNGPPGNLWRPLDEVAAEVSAVHGAETYSNITVNGKPAKSIPAGGAWNAGEFTSELLSVLAPERAAVFTKPRPGTIRTHPAIGYEFSVNQKNSAWRLAAGNLPRAPTVENYTTAYAGTVWIARDTGQVLRIQMSARDLPSYFPLGILISNTDFDFVTLGGKEYLLPTRSETVTCQNNALLCLKNETVFRNYDKFVSGASISFDGPAQ